jgi:hypothetical protein
MAKTIGEHERYEDPDLGLDEADGGLISAEALDRARRALGSLANAADPLGLTEWFGMAMTEPKAWLQPQGEEAPDPAVIVARLRQGDRLRRHGMALLARARVDSVALVFACGEAWRLPAGLWPAATARVELIEFGAAELGGALEQPVVGEVLAGLVGVGALVWNDDGDLT